MQGILLAKSLNSPPLPPPFLLEKGDSGHTPGWPVPQWGGRDQVLPLLMGKCREGSNVVTSAGHANPE